MELDVLQGEERVLDERGIVVETIPWDNGKREGVALGFATDANQERGRIIRRMGYRNDLLRWVEEVNRFDDQGRKTSKWLTFWSNGRIREEGPWERGLKEGVFKRFSVREIWKGRKPGTEGNWWRMHRKLWHWICVRRSTPMVRCLARALAGEHAHGNASVL